MFHGRRGIIAMHQAVGAGSTGQILIWHGNCYNIDFKHNLNIDLSAILQHCVNVQ